MLSEPIAYFLIAHGSRDPRSQQALEGCVQQLRQDWSAVASLPSCAVAGGTLELSAVPLATQIETFARHMKEQGVGRIRLLPLFLMAGNHVNEDIPQAVAQAQAALPATVQLELCPPVGSHPIWQGAVRQQLERIRSDRRLLVAHGTRRAGGNQPLEDFAARCQAEVAYWAIAPSMADQLQTMEQAIEQRAQRVVILPYFLFPGYICDRIQAEVEQLRRTFPQLQLILIEPPQVSTLLMPLVLHLERATLTLPL